MGNISKLYAKRVPRYTFDVYSTRIGNEYDIVIRILVFNESRCRYEFISYISPINLGTLSGKHPELIVRILDLVERLPIITHPIQDLPFLGMAYRFTTLTYAEQVIVVLNDIFSSIKCNQVAACLT